MKQNFGVRMWHGALVFGRPSELLCWDRLVRDASCSAWARENASVQLGSENPDVEKGSVPPLGKPRGGVVGSKATDLNGSAANVRAPKIVGSLKLYCHRRYRASSFAANRHAALAIWFVG